MLFEFCNYLWFSLFLAIFKLYIKLFIGRLFFGNSKHEAPYKISFAKSLRSCWYANWWLYGYLYGFLPLLGVEKLLINSSAKQEPLPALLNKELTHLSQASYKKLNLPFGFRF